MSEEGRCEPQERCLREVRLVCATVRAGLMSGNFEDEDESEGVPEWSKQPFYGEPVERRVVGLGDEVR